MKSVTNYPRGVFMLCTVVLCLATAFLVIDCFVEKELTSQSYAFIFGAVIYAFFAMLTYRMVNLAFDRMTFLVLILAGYIWLRMIISGYFGINTLLVAAFTISYLVFRLIGRPYSPIILCTIVSTCLILAVYGLAQFAEVMPSHGAFRMVGNFDNPAGVAACLSCGYPFCFALLKRHNKMKWLGAIALPVIFMAVILSGSRAGMIAIVSATTLYLASGYKIRIKRKTIFVSIALAIVLLGGAGLFFLKKDSAFGRVLIWTVSGQMIKEAPLAGHGPGAFESEYMPYQAQYFKTHPDSQYARLADTVTHPFNEYLLLTIEYGIVGLLLLLACGGVMLLCRVSISPALLSISAIAVFACFSYPLRYAFVLLVLAYALSQIRCGKSIPIHFNRTFKAALLLCAAAMSVFLIRDIRFEMAWSALTRSWALPNQNIIQRYESLHRRWNHNPLFLYNYGAVLNRDKLFRESQDIMARCEKHLNDYDVQMIKGDNWFNLHNYKEALAAYSQAADMCPNRFMPLYRIFCIYKAENRTKEAQELALQLVAKPVKVPSATIRQIIREMNAYLSESGPE